MRERLDSMRLRRLFAVIFGLSLFFGTALAFATDVPPGPPPHNTKAAASAGLGSKAPEAVAFMTKGRKKAIFAALIAAMFLVVGGAAGRNDKAGAGERIGPTPKT